MFHKTQITLPWNKYFRQYMMQQEFPQFFLNRSFASKNQVN